MRVSYVGPHDAVEVPDVGIAVRRNEPVDVPDADAEKLLRQPEAWEKVAAPKAPAKKGSDD